LPGASRRRDRAITATWRRRRSSAPLLGRAVLRRSARPGRGTGGHGDFRGRLRRSLRIVLDPAGAHLEPGEILVARATDPAWTSLFLTAGALVTETGGMMSYGSIVARKYGIPAVLGRAGRDDPASYHPTRRTRRHRWHGATRERTANRGFPDRAGTPATRLRTGPRLSGRFETGNRRPAGSGRSKGSSARCARGQRRASTTPGREPPFPPVPRAPRAGGSTGATAPPSPRWRRARAGGQARAAQRGSRPAPSRAA